MKSTKTSVKNTTTRQSKKRSGNKTELVEAVVNGVQDLSLVEKRRDQICDAALELFLEKGFATTTIRDICAKSGVNQASIYDYIANKNDILRRLLNKVWFRPDVPTLSQRLEQHSHLPLADNVAEYYRDTWSKKRKGTLLAYRTVAYLQEDDRKAMRNREQAITSDLAKQLERFSALPGNDPRLEIIAQIVIYLASFAPMRDWLMKDIDNDLILETVSTAVAAMIDGLGMGMELEMGPTAKNKRAKD